MQLNRTLTYILSNINAYVQSTKTYHYNALACLRMKNKYFGSKINIIISKVYVKH